MKSLLYLAVFILVGGLICSKTKPEKADHVNSLSTVVAQEIKSGNLLPGIAGTDFAKTATDPRFVKNVLNSMLVLESYGVFTIGKIRWQEEEYVVSLGILGKVFTFADARVANDFIKSFKDVDVEKWQKEEL
jgi:hypothetical protein